MTNKTNIETEQQEISLGKKYRVYETSCFTKMNTEYICVILRTQTSLIKCTLSDRDHSGELSLLNIEEISSMLDSNEDSIQNCVSFVSEPDLSLYPILSIWRDSSTNSRNVKIFDIESSSPIREYSTPRKIQSLSRLDKLGMTYVAFDYKGALIFDTREKEMNNYLKITEKEKQITIVHEGFKQGRLINFVTNNNISCFDMRNPGEMVLQIDHLSRVPPTVAFKNTEVTDWELEYTLESNDEEFEKSLDLLILKGEGSYIDEEFESGVLKSSFGIFSPARAGDFFLINSIQPMRRGVDVRNNFNYEVIKEINNSLVNMNLFDGLTRFRKWPLKLYSSNYESDDHRIRGGRFLNLTNRMLCFSIDNKDRLLFQGVSVEKDNVLSMAKIDFDQNLEAEHKTYNSNFLIIKPTSSLLPVDLSSSCDELEELAPEPIYKEYIDIRRAASKIASGSLFTANMSDSQRSTYTSLSKEPERIPPPKAPLEFIPLEKEEVDRMASLSNNKFFLTSGIINALKESWEEIN